MPITFDNVSPDKVIAYSDQYRLTYDVAQIPFVPSRSDEVEANVYEALPKVGLVPRSLPLAISDDPVITVRVQPSDPLQNKTVRQLADVANFTGGDFRLGPQSFLGWDVELSHVEFVGSTGAGAIPSGTSATPTDTTAQNTARQKAEEEGNTLDKVIRVLGLVAVIAAIGVGAYVIFKVTD